MGKARDDEEEEGSQGSESSRRSRLSLMRHRAPHTRAQVDASRMPKKSAAINASIGNGQLRADALLKR
jgi:hypothetical protein